MSYRNDVDALAARHAALEFEVVEKTKERNAAAHLLDEARARAKLPILDNIRVATPCSADWDQMSGDERVRACGACNKNVYNLSSMTRDEAETLIVAKEGRLCVRYYQRADGTILLADCTVGKSQKRKRRVIAAGAAALLAGSGVLAWKLSRPSPAERLELLQGQMRVPVDDHYTPTIEAPSPPPQALVPEREIHDVMEVKGRMVIDRSDR